MGLNAPIRNNEHDSDYDYCTKCGNYYRDCMCEVLWPTNRIEPTEDTGVYDDLPDEGFVEEE
jgi:hypothetical protein